MKAFSVVKDIGFYTSSALSNQLSRATRTRIITRRTYRITGVTSIVVKGSRGRTIISTCTGASKEIPCFTLRARVNIIT